MNLSKPDVTDADACDRIAADHERVAAEYLARARWFTDTAIKYRDKAREARRNQGRAA